MSDSDSDSIPDVATCQRRCEEFASITATDEVCAQFYLQDRSWDVQRAVNAYFEATTSSGVKILQDGNTPEMVIKVNREMADAMKTSLVDKEVEKFKFITWNIDGLDERNSNIRVKAVAQIIKSEDADIVHLQEVIPDTQKYLESQLTEYTFIPGCNTDYFCVTLLKKNTVEYLQHRVIPFRNTVMGRNLIATKVHVGGVPLTTLNSHLESTAEYSKERINQLNLGFKMCNDAEPGETVVFAGDLNLRDKELAQSGGIPPSVQDLWITCGQRDVCRYTWDTQRNTNCQLSAKFKPRCRFDRVYQRFSTNGDIKPNHFGLIGIEKIKGSQCFPSDHWGIIVHFEINRKNSD